MHEHILSHTIQLVSSVRFLFLVLLKLLVYMPPHPSSFYKIQSKTRLRYVILNFIYII
jgi:hypothetical protein